MAHLKLFLASDSFTLFCSSLKWDLSPSDNSHFVIGNGNGLGNEQEHEIALYFGRYLLCFPVETGNRLGRMCYQRGWGWVSLLECTSRVSRFRSTPPNPSRQVQRWRKTTQMELPPQIYFSQYHRRCFLGRLRNCCPRHLARL